ncbi:GNAT family N-acetyltransferase [Nitrobacter sp. TKz-YC02]|uniref:GNAT family N-acetyltransferase n=1 Tax=Nitrobacter sp. TKz-YC02 TaxID=3398704 RepID=UPI003CF7CBDF
MTAPYRIEILRTHLEVEALREFWNACNPRRDADLDFFLFIVDIYGEAERPHVVVLYERDVPRALLAARLEVGYVSVKLGYFALPVPKLRILQIVHGGWLGDITEVNSKLLIGSILNSLATGEADAASLHSPDLDSPIVRSARMLRYWWCADHCVASQARRVRDLSGPPGSFMSSLSQNERYQQRKRARNLAQAFRNCRIECFRSSAEIDRLVRDAEVIAAKSYQRGLNVGFSETPEIRSRLEFEARKGWLRGYILYLDEQPSAFWIGSLRNQVFLSEYLSFDPAYAKYTPGMYLMMKVIENLNDDERLDDPVRLIDFGIGDTSYKERLANRHWQESAVYIFAPRIKAVWTNALRSSVGLMNRSAKHMLRLTPWLASIKRTWRARVAQNER